MLQELLEPYSRRLANYCSPKLLPLLDLPRVKVGRARQVQGAGFTGVGDIARILINLIRLLARCQDMVNNYTDMANEWRLPKLVSSCKDLFLSLPKPPSQDSLVEYQIKIQFLPEVYDI